MLVGSLPPTAWRRHAKHERKSATIVPDVCFLRREDIQILINTSHPTAPDILSRTLTGCLCCGQCVRGCRSRHTGDKPSPDDQRLHRRTPHGIPGAYPRRGDHACSHAMSRGKGTRMACHRPTPAHSAILPISPSLSLPVRLRPQRRVSHA